MVRTSLDLSINFPEVLRFFLDIPGIRHKITEFSSAYIYINGFSGLCSQIQGFSRSSSLLKWMSSTPLYGLNLAQANLDMFSPFSKKIFRTSKYYFIVNHLQ